MGIFFFFLLFKLTQLINLFKINNQTGYALNRCFISWLNTKQKNMSKRRDMIFHIIVALLHAKAHSLKKWFKQCLSISKFMEKFHKKKLDHIRFIKKWAFTPKVKLLNEKWPRTLRRQWIVKAVESGGGRDWNFGTSSWIWTMVLYLISWVNSNHLLNFSEPQYLPINPGKWFLVDRIILTFRDHVFEKCLTSSFW